MEPDLDPPEDWCGKDIEFLVIMRTTPSTGGYRN